MSSSKMSTSPVSHTLGLATSELEKTIVPNRLSVYRKNSRFQLLNTGWLASYMMTHELQTILTDTVVAVSRFGVDSRFIIEPAYIVQKPCLTDV